ncbi:MAG: putative cation transport ATPase [Candidatus Kaiserbacteria bacterium GW2011_GWA2_58_9]|uniref:Putative cation transport ATPase n=1 Tax=Candidatus Kaiserbacteria bacterium GW2011_GWA2_58_9 TaxID=1618672 RepID=A0A0G1YQD0_9BACT|nr:MAG: putative cation transport ATPase [Candidatus Kaiserbacteria bacterium GW2011_GWA2_58_9]
MPPRIEWYREPLSEIFKTLSSAERGLSEEEARRRLLEHGPNALPEAKPESYFSIFARQFKSPLIYILAGASAVIFALGEPVDGSIILAILLFNAVVGSIQEGRAQNTLRALRHFVETQATVLRGKELIVKDAEVVRGDTIILHEGEKVPADARLILAHNLRVDESALTGESEPVQKEHDAALPEGLPVAEQRTMLFKGTNVAAGNGRALVVATGGETEIGRIAKEIAVPDTEIPLQASIRYLSRSIIAVVLAAGLCIFFLGLAKGLSVVQMFATVVSLAVSVIPEGLPIVMTLVLATGVWRMGKRNALVKRLAAVEALGQASVIAVDKTGTLLFIGKMAAFCADARVVYSDEEKRWRVAGDPTEAALLVFAEKLGFHKEDLESESPLLGELPFDSVRKYQASVHREGHANILSVVGAPEVVLKRSHLVRRSGHGEPISAAERKELEELFLSWSREGLRVIGVAEKREVAEGLADEDVRALTFVGFFGMKDGLREGVRESLEQARDAGIRVVMITGDHKVTASAIAKDAGIWKPNDLVLTGEEMDALSDAALTDKLANASVFARVTPEHKLRIIRAYKARGEIIAMTGDGVNDAPSLIAADLGVAMGGIGTEVAKEASDIVLLDDNFGSIVSAVEEGRSIYKTIKKVILYLFSTGLGEAFTIVGAIFMGFAVPVLPAQIIWLNFVTDGFLDVALAMEPKEQGLLERGYGRAKKYLLDRLAVERMVVMALPMAVGALILFDMYAAEGFAKASTVVLSALAVFQWFNAWNCRAEKESLFSQNFFGNAYLVGATGLVICLQLLAVYNPFLQGILHTVPLSLSDWLIIVPVAASIVLAEELRKFSARALSPVY